MTPESTRNGFKEAFDVPSGSTHGQRETESMPPCAASAGGQGTYVAVMVPPLQTLGAPMAADDALHAGGTLSAVCPRHDVRDPGDVRAFRDFGNAEEAASRSPNKSIRMRGQHPGLLRAASPCGASPRRTRRTRSLCSYPQDKATAGRGRRGTPRRP